jgi:tetratricopeptide (TPR) repeat protein
VDAETYYLLNQAILNDAANRMLPPAENAARHAWALEHMKDAPYGGQDYAEQMARHAHFAQVTRSPATDRALAELEIHYLNVAWRQAIRDHRIAEALVLVERLSGLKQVTLHDRVDALLKTSVALRLDQRPREAADYANRALEIAESAGQRAWAYQELGNAFNTGRRIEEADDAYQQALKLARECGDGRLQSGALCNLGSIRRQSGRNEEALVLLNEALRVAREAGAADYEGTSHLHLGFLCSMRGKRLEAKAEFERALATLENTGKEIFRVDACYHLGDLALQDGDFATAERYVELALAIARRLGYRTGLTQALNIAAMVHDSAGRLGDAIGALREAVSVARESGDLLNAAVGLTNLGHALLRASRLDEAEETFTHAEEAAELGRNTYAAGFAASGLGDVRRARGRLVEAWMTYERAIQLMDVAGFKPGVVRVRAKLGGVMAESGEIDAAVAQLQECVATARQMGLREEYDLATTELARVRR